MDPIVLCADSESLRHPEMIGLEGVKLDEVPWLTSFSCATELRSYAQQAPMPQEFWIASADDMEAINLGAALKLDAPLRTIRLVVSDATGSVLSRAHAAQVDEVLPLWRFAQRFRTETQRRAVMAMSGSGKREGEGAKVPFSRTGPQGVQKAKTPSSAMAVAGPVATMPSEAGVDRTMVMAPIAAGGDAPVEVPAGKSALVLSVVSGSGGAGKSTVALYAALLAQARGHRTLLIDGDLQFGDLRTVLNAKDAPTVVDVLQASDPMAMLRSAEAAPAFIAAPRKLEEAEACAHHLPQLLDRVVPFFDVVVVDTGASWIDYHAPLIERSARTLFLIDQRASSVRACQHALDVCLRSGIAIGSFLFALNRCSRHGLFTSIDVSCALNGAHVVELKEGGGSVEEACGAGMPLELLREKNELCASLEDVLVTMLPENGAGAAGAIARGRSKGRLWEAGARGERRSSRRGRHGKRERGGAIEMMASDGLAAGRSVA